MFVISHYFFHYSVRSPDSFKLSGISSLNFFDLEKTIVYVKMLMTSYTTLMKKAYTNYQQLVQLFAYALDAFHSFYIFSLDEVYYTQIYKNWSADLFSNLVKSVWTRSKQQISFIVVTKGPTQSKVSIDVTATPCCSNAAF